MATARILFNDYFNKDTYQLTDFGTGVVAGKTGAQRRDELFTAWTDGRAETIGTLDDSADQSISVAVKSGISLAISGATFAVGLVNIGETGFSVGYSGDAPIECPCGNAIVPRAIAAFVNGLFHIGIDRTTDSSLGLLYVGNYKQIECFYPRGWRPPIVQPVRDDIRFSNNGFPVSRYTVREPFETTIPVRHFDVDGNDGNALVELKALLRRMQREPFLFQWSIDRPADPVLWGWAERVHNFRYSSPRRIDCDIVLKGYFSYS